MAVRLATGPVCWGVDFADSPSNPPWERVLDEIARSGISAIELGPLGYLPEDPDALSAQLAARRLDVAASFVFEPLHDPRALRDVLAATRRTCALIAGAGGRHLVVIDVVDRHRVMSAGRADDAPRLAGPAWDLLLEAIRTVSEIAAGEFGLRPVLHPHAGTFIEFEDEIEAALAALDPEVIGLCVDTGHCAFAGVDPVALYRRHAARVTHLHLKDVDAHVLERVGVERLDFWQAIDRGVFCALGNGCVDFPALSVALREHGFDGTATIEQDRDPRRPGDALADVVASREYLEAIGLGGRAPSKASTR